MNARRDDDTIAAVNEKLDPSAREDRKRRMKAACMNIYPARIIKMSRESACCVELAFVLNAHNCRAYLCQFPEANYKSSCSIRDPLATSHFADRLSWLVFDVKPDSIRIFREGCLRFQRVHEPLTSATRKRQGLHA